MLLEHDVVDSDEIYFVGGEAHNSVGMCREDADLRNLCEILSNVLGSCKNGLGLLGETIAALLHECGPCSSNHGP